MGRQIQWWRRGAFISIFAAVWGTVLLVSGAIFFVNGDRATALAAVLGVLTTVAGLLVSQIERFATRGRQRMDAQSNESWPEDMADQLARAVQEQWTVEANLRRLHDPEPLDVRWTKEADLTDPAYAPSRTKTSGASAWTDMPDEGDFDKIVDFFSTLPSGRLVVLGPLGSGKSVLALFLLLELLERREPGDPVPVLFRLSTWNPVMTTLDDWLVDQLTQGYQLSSPIERDPRAIARRLLRDRLILPVLDGLDELAGQVRPQAITDINAWLGRDRQAVLTSRTPEYQAAVAEGDVVTRGAAILLQPLELEVVENYLRRATAPPRARRWKSVFAELRTNPHGPVAVALRTPLMVALARAIYGDRPGDATVLLESRFTSPELVEEHLLGELIQATYPDPRRGMSADDIQNWLTFLARELNVQGHRDIAWWQLEDAAPPVVVHAIAAAGGALVVGFVFGPIGATIFSLAALFLAGGNRSRRWTLESLLKAPLESLLHRFRDSSPRAGLVANVLGLSERASIERRISLSAGRLVALVAGLIQGFVVYQTHGLYRAVAEGVGLGLAVGLADGYLTVAIRSSPTEVRLPSRRGVGAFVRHIAVGFAIGVGAGVTGWAITSSWFGVLVGVVVGLAFGVIDGLNIWLDVSTDVALALSPRSTRRAERLAAIARSATVGVTLALTTGTAYAFAYGLRAAVVPALVFGLGFAIADHHMGLATSVWGRYVVAKAWLALRGKVPWRFMLFLDDTHRRGLLRNAGAVYQFRHVRFQEYLVGPRPDRQTAEV